MKFACRPAAHPLVRESMILLEESGLGLAEACNKAGLDPGTVANWRHGKYTPNIFVFSLLLGAMGYELKIGRIDDD